MSTPCKIIGIENETIRITYLSSDGYPEYMLPILKTFKTIEDIQPEEYPVYNELNDPHFDWDYKYVLDFNKGQLEVHGDDCIKIYDLETQNLIDVLD